jgi:hypothetical protein
MNTEQQNWMNGSLDCWIIGRQSEAAHPSIHLSNNPFVLLAESVV